jgi:hypothetical protein
MRAKIQLLQMTASAKAPMHFPVFAPKMHLCRLLKVQISSIDLSGKAQSPGLVRPQCLPEVSALQNVALFDKTINVFK